MTCQIKHECCKIYYAQINCFINKCLSSEVDNDDLQTPIMPKSALANSSKSRSTTKKARLDPYALDIPDDKVLLFLLNIRLPAL